MKVKSKTNLKCGSCVEKIRPALDKNPLVRDWSVDLASNDRILTVEGPGANEAFVTGILKQAGFQSRGFVDDSAPSLALLSHDEANTSVDVTSIPLAEAVDAKEIPTSYFPLILIVTYLLVVTGTIELAFGTWDWMRAMSHFMAAFFLVFSFFKLLNLSAFASSYAGYDILAKNFPLYGYIYPWIELGLGLAFLTGWNPILVNVVTLVVMGISTVGVVQSLLAKRKIRCACLGAVFNLPMSYVTLIEDLTMAVMSLFMIYWHWIEVSA